MATPAVAQDGSENASERTPETAQTFLATYLQRGGWEALSFGWFDGRSYHYYKDGWRESAERVMAISAQDPVYGDVSGVASPDACTIVLTVAVKWKGRVFIEDGLIPITPKQVTAFIDWRTVDPIKVEKQSMLSRERSGARVTTRSHTFAVWNPKTKSGVIFTTHEESVADRAAFAMNFLKEKCDPTAGTAF